MTLKVLVRKMHTKVLIRMNDNYSNETTTFFGRSCAIYLVEYLDFFLAGNKLMLRVIISVVTLDIV